MFENGDFLKGCNIELENSNGRISEVTQNATRLEVQIKDLLSEFECINNELKPLPEECFVTMRLVYNKDTPEKYNPEGFVTDDKGDMSVSNQGKGLKAWSSPSYNIFDDIWPPKTFSPKRIEVWSKFRANPSHNCNFRNTF